MKLQAKKAYGGVQAWLHMFLILVLNYAHIWRCVSSQLYSSAKPKERASDCYWIGVWMVSRAGLGALEKRHISCSCQDKYIMNSN